MVKKWGNDMAIVIPRQFAKVRRIEVGVMLDIDGIKIVKRRRYRLA
jgi:antitoxin component of MazEF toxin-antitoxin module